MLLTALCNLTLTRQCGRSLSHLPDSGKGQQLQREEVTYTNMHLQPQQQPRHRTAQLRLQDIKKDCDLILKDEL